MKTSAMYDVRDVAQAYSLLAFMVCRADKLPMTPEWEDTCRALASFYYDTSFLDKKLTVSAGRKKLTENEYSPRVIELCSNPDFVTDLKTLPMEKVSDKYHCNFYTMQKCKTRLGIPQRKTQLDKLLELKENSPEFCDDARKLSIEKLALKYGFKNSSMFFNNIEQLGLR